MIPTTHLRWFTDAVNKPPVLQQFWVNVRPDDAETMERVWDWLPSHLEGEYGGEWRELPLIYESR